MARTGAKLDVRLVNPPQPGPGLGPILAVFGPCTLCERTKIGSKLPEPKANLDPAFGREPVPNRPCILPESGSLLIERG